MEKKTQKTKTLKPKAVKPKTKPKKAEIKVVDEYDIEDRMARIKLAENPVKDEVPKTILQKLAVLSDKRNVLCGKLQTKLRLLNRDEIEIEVAKLNKEIAELKIVKVKEDAKGR